MANLNNPAGRLLSLLERALKHDASARGQDVWASVFEIDPAQTDKLLKRYSQILKLPAQIRSEVEKLDDVDHELLLKYLPKIEQGFSILNLSSKWTTFRNQLTEIVLYSLKTIDDRLGRESPDLRIDLEAIFEIADDVETLFDDVNADTTLPPDFRDFLKGRIVAIQDSIAEFTITGVAPIREVIEATVGAAVLNSEEMKSNASIPEWSRFWKLIGRLAIVIELATSGQALLDKTADLLALPPADRIEMHTGEAVLPNRDDIDLGDDLEDHSNGTA